MKKLILILLALIIVVAGGWYWVAHRAAPGPGDAPAQQTQVTPESLPEPVLGTIASTSPTALTLTLMTGETRAAIFDRTTLLFKNGTTTTQAALKKGQMVAVVYYPASVGADDIAHTITVVSTQ